MAKQKRHSGKGNGLGRKWEFALIPAATLLAVVLCFFTDSEESPTLRLSEVCPHNFNLAADCCGNYSDYIELYNEGTQPVNLADYYLSDDRGKSGRFRLPDLELGAGEYLIVWADGTGMECGCEGETHADFRISDGETVTLTTGEGTLVDAVEVTGLADNVSITRLNGESVKAYGTPGMKNDGCELYREPLPNLPGSSGDTDAGDPVQELHGENIRISEICPHNFNLAANCVGSYSDYIEICNEGDTAVNLSGYFLSDDRKNPARFAFPDMELDAGECIVVWADGVGEDCKCGSGLHADFRISDGETVILSVEGRGIVDEIELDALPDNVSVTKLGGTFVKAYGTPGAGNGGCELYRAATLDLPVFSLESGFYTSDSIRLEINVPQGVTVYYTTDGSIPDENSEVYTGALVLTDASAAPNRYVNIRNTVSNYDNHKVNNDPVDKATVVRAIAVDEEGRFSEVKTATFFIGDTAEKYEGYAVLSIVSDPDGLFGGDGICVTGTAYDEWYNNTDRSTKAPVANFQQHGREWERETTIQLWDKDRNLVLDQDCGMRVQGNTWRTYAIKRFSFYAREHYGGNDVFDAQIFPSAQTSGSFYLRSDAADIIAQDLVADRDLAVQEGIPAVCFLDGEFYSTTYLRERHDSTYFEEHYGVAEDDVVVITCGELDEGSEEDLEAYREFIRFVTNADMTDPDVYAQLEKQMDVQSFIDFMAANMYCNNLDIATNHNFKMWRSRTDDGEGYSDGRWRMALYDMDSVIWAYDVRTDSSFAECDPFRYTAGVGAKYGAQSRKLISIPFFRNLLKNQSFRDRFVTTYLDMMNTNFAARSYGGEVCALHGVAQSGIWRVLLEERHSHAIEHLRNEFDLQGEACPVTIEVGEGGAVFVNTTEAYGQDGIWNATYIGGMELTIAAVPEEGWSFVGWQGDMVSGEASTSILLDDGGISLKAVFERKGEE